MSSGQAHLHRCPGIDGACTSLIDSDIGLCARCRRAHTFTPSRAISARERPAGNFAMAAPAGPTLTEATQRKDTHDG